MKVDLEEGRVLGAWTGWAATWGMARGEPGAFGRVWNAPWVWLTLGALFLLPFVDPRRPFRLLHLDLLVLLGFGVSHVAFNRGDIETSVPLVYPVLAYLVVRCCSPWSGPGDGGGGPLVPLVPIRWLGAGALVLLAARIGLNIVDSNVIDVGFASVIGADHILDGEPLYGEGFARRPAERRHLRPDDLPRLRAVRRRCSGGAASGTRSPPPMRAAITFDALTAGALVLLGRRMRPGADGAALGVALAWAWLAYPWTAFVLMTNANDTLVALLLTLALLALASPAARGLWLGLASAAKFGPLALAPLMAWRDRDHEPLRDAPGLRGGARGDDRRGHRPAACRTAASASSTTARSASRSGASRRSASGACTPRSTSLHLLVQVAAVNLALLLLLVPARRGRWQVAAPRRRGPDRPPDGGGALVLPLHRLVAPVRPRRRHGEGW